jgi:hypothetical protein
MEVAYADPDDEVNGTLWPTSNKQLGVKRVRP